MKTIHKFTTVLLAYMICGTTFTQVYTPNGTPVEYIHFSEGNVALMEDLAEEFLMTRGWTHLVIKTAPATMSYNCHSFAWNMSEGGITCWINPSTEHEFGNYIDNPSATPPTFPDNIKKYLDDRSYYEVPESLATKVWYGTNWEWNTLWGIPSWFNYGDHSAIRITSGPNAGKYESKWGGWPQYIHPANVTPLDVIFDITQARFFRRSPVISGPENVCTSGIVYTLSGHLPGSITWSVTGPFTCTPDPNNPAEVIVYRTGSSTGKGVLQVITSGSWFAKNIEATCAITISGPDVVCFGTGSTFTVSGAPSGFTWEHSPNLVLSGSGSSVTVSKENASTYCFNGNGIGWVSIKNSDGKELVRKNVWAGAPLLFVTPTESAVDPWSSRTFYADLTNNMSAPSQYEWVFRKASQFTYHYTTFNWKDFYFEEEGFYQVHCRGYNVCGYGEYDVIDLSSWSPSPPHISYPNPVSDVLTVEIVSGFSAAGIAGNASSFAYDIRMYDGHGNILRQVATQGGNVEFNVSNLPNGVYYLHIYDGVNDEPEIHLIVVER